MGHHVFPPLSVQHRCIHNRLTSEVEPHRVLTPNKPVFRVGFRVSLNPLYTLPSYLSPSPPWSQSSSSSTPPLLAWPPPPPPPPQQSACGRQSHPVLPVLPVLLRRQRAMQPRPRLRAQLQRMLPQKMPHRLRTFMFDLGANGGAWLGREEGWGGGKAQGSE